MKLRFAGFCAMLPCLVATGCHRRYVAVVPPAPPPPVMISVPPPTHVSEPLPLVDTEDSASLTLVLPRRSGPRFRPLPATPAQLAALNPPAPPPVALGQLTAGGEAGNSTLRQQAEDLLRSQLRRLAALPPALSASHSQQVQQAKLFLRQAGEAWDKLDVEGTRTLATKAKVLLDEL